MHAELDLGATQVSYCVQRNFTYFKFQLDDASNFTISVTPINGDPDVYVSTTNQKPNRNDFEWSAALFGFDGLSIHTTDQHYKPNGVYYIGVYGFFLDTYFAISINKKDTYTDLIEGIASSNYVEANGDRYFKFTLKNPGHTLSFTVDPLISSGDPDLYVTTNITSGPPSKTNHQWSAESFSGDAIVVPSARATTYYIAVHGYRIETPFQLLVQTEYTSTQLNDGVDQLGVVGPGQYTYYKFAHGDSVSGLSITVTPTQQDSVEVYASTETTRPDANKYQYLAGRSESGGRFFYFPPPTNTGTYYFGVYSRTSATFTISAQTLQTATVLRDAEPNYENQVPSGLYRLFVFDYPPGQKKDLSISVLPWEGDVDLFVSATIERPKKDNYTWYSNGWREDTVVIPANDPNIQGKNRVFISVYGASQTTGYFAILALISGGSVPLKDGVVLSGSVATDRYQYYSFEVTNAGSININLELSSADDEADLYVSTHTEKPTKYDRDYASTEFGNDFLNIPNAPAGVYHIGVYGQYASGDKIPYTITVRQNHQSLPVNRFNMFEVAPQGSSYQFRTYVSPYSEGLMFATTLISGRTNMYISTNSSILPTKDRNDFAATSWPGNSIFVPKNNPKFVSGGDWLVVVEALENSNYFISASSLPYFAYIREGVPRFGVAPSETPILYAFWLPYANATEQEDYYFSIRVLNGAVDVYMNQDYANIPSEQHNILFSKGPNDRLMKLDKSLLKFGRTLYMALYGIGSSSHYEVSLNKASSPRYLALDQPQTQTTVPGQYTYFRSLNNVQNPQALNIVVEACTTEPAPYVYVSSNADNKKPTKDKKDFASTRSKNTRVQTVQTSKSTKAEYYLSVLMNEKEATVYSIHASTDFGSRPLVKKPVLSGGPMKSKQVRLTIPMAVPPPKFADRSFYYTVYLVELTKKNNKYLPFNFDTVCGIQYYGIEAGTAKVDPTAKNVQYLVDIDPKKEYAVNVIVSDSFGLSTAYQPAYILKGSFTTTLNPSIRKISVGGVFILLGMIAIVAYLTIGAGYNAFKGERGVAIIPNHEFWMDLPSLLLDGVKFVISCGRVNTGYSEFDRASTGSTNTGASQDSGYGAI